MIYFLLIKLLCSNNDVVTIFKIKSMFNVKTTNKLKGWIKFKFFNKLTFLLLFDWHNQPNLSEATFHIQLKSNVRWLLRLPWSNLVNFPADLRRVKPIQRRCNIISEIADYAYRSTVSALKSRNCAFRRTTRGYRLLLRNASLATTVCIQLRPSNSTIVKRLMAPFITGTAPNS